MTDAEVFECMQCGADLRVGVTHYCPVGGNEVLVVGEQQEGDHDG